MSGAAIRLGTAAGAEPPAVFGVEQSLLGRCWRFRPHDEAVAARLGASGELSDLVARLVAARGVDAPGLEGFLEPSLRETLPDPSGLVAMDAAADRLAAAVETGESIAVLADYDVDGATSAALLIRYLRAVGVRPAVHVPDRLKEGYGPNAPALSRLAAAGASLVVCVDCGIAAHEAFRDHALGHPQCDIVVFDHHQAGEDLPAARALVNPNRLDDVSGLGHLAAAGVTFLGLVALNRALRRRGYFAGRDEPDLLPLLGLVALGTICDVVPLTGLNRTFVTQGLKMLRRGRDVGIGALAALGRLDGPPGVYHLGFVLGPRINAGGRVGRSDLGVRLLTTEDPHEAEALAAELERLNRERQAVEAAATATAMEQAQDLSAEASGVLVVAGQDWHPGVVGLVAARIKERFRRPAVAISLGSDGLARGSARSIAGVDIGAGIRAAVQAGVVQKGGGHAMAAGLTLSPDRLGDLGAFLDAMLGEAVSAARLSDSLSIDAPLSAGAAGEELLSWLERIGPFGQGHPEPRFAFPAHAIAFAARAGEAHVRATLRAGDGRRIEAIAFRVAGTPLDRALLGMDGLPLHVAGKLRTNTWNGRTRPQLVIDDAARVRA